jgi:Carboxypeptidase regulatory-like domain/TonB dependent receptor-like, beta-barrel
VQIRCVPVLEESLPVPLRNTVLIPLVACAFLQASVEGHQAVGTTTGAISGKLTDASGAVLPGVTIALSSEAIMGNDGTRATVTGADGLYRFPALPPGEYSLLFSLEGFRTVSRERIYVGVGFTATVNIMLEVGAVTQNVTVERRSPVIDTHSTAIATRFDARQLADLPGSRSTFAILTAAPSVQVAHFEVGGSSGDSGAPYGAYGTRGANRPMVEGINVAGIFPSGFTLDYGSFSEVSVGTAVHGAEWPAPGVQMQFISKSGGNQYHGAVYADYENHNWQSFNIDESQISSQAQGGGALSPREANRLWSYHDLNADVGGYIRPDSLWWYSSFRKQNVSARQVNFPVKPLETHLTNYTAKLTDQMNPSNKLVFFAQSGRNHQPNLVDEFTLPAAVSLAEESTSKLLASGWIWKGEWDSVVNHKMLFDIRIGEFATQRPERPNGTAPRFEDVITSVVQGGNRDWQENRRSNQVFGSVSYFKDDWLGNHQFKAGGELFRTTVTDIWRKGYPGDVLHVVRNGDPAEVYLFQTPSNSESGLWTYSGYAGDLWRLNDRLTLSPGLRFDRFRVFFPQQTHPPGLFNPTLQRFAAVDDVIDWNVLAPRIGAIFDPSGNARTLLKFNYGQYWFSPGTNLGPNANPNSPDWWQHYSWSDLNKNGVWDRGEEGRPIESRGGAELESRDPELHLSRLREVAASLERELFADVGIRTSIVWRGERHHYLRHNPNRPFGAFSVPVSLRDPGPDNVVGTEDDGPDIRAFELNADAASLPQLNVVGNVPHSDSEYWTWDITATRRFSRRWSLVAGFANTWNYDQASAYSGQSVRQNTYALTPNDLINAGKDGRYEFTTWSAKIYGTYEGPWALRITPYLRHQSGQPFGRTFVARLNYGNVRILAEPIDTRRMDNITLLDVRLEKGFQLAEHRRIAGFVDAFNLLNANPPETAIWASGPSFLRPLNIVSPRIARIGAKLEW